MRLGLALGFRAVRGRRQERNSLCAGARFLLALAEACGLAPQPAEVIQLCASNCAGPYDVDVIDDRGIQRENALDTLTEADLADSHRLAEAAVVARNHRA